jgi:hypothetical protein
MVDTTKTIGSSGAVSPQSEAGAPEITPAMVKAGVLKLFDYDPMFSNEAEIVIQIFQAMLAEANAGPANKEAAQSF